MEAAVAVQLPLPGRAAVAAPDGDERGQPRPEGGGRHQQHQNQETEEEHAQAVYCAVGIGTGSGSRNQARAAKEWKANLRWVLAALAPRRSSSKRLVLAHLRRPTSRMNISACLPCPSSAPSAFSLETHASIMHSLPLLCLPACIFLQLPPLRFFFLLVVSYVR